MECIFLMFLDHTQRRIAVSRTPLDERSARRRDLYLTTHDTHKRQISMPPVGFEPTISAGERPAAAHLLRSNRNEYQEYFLGSKDGRCLGLTTLPPLSADCLEI
jgi:hypothetical protein